MLNHFFKLIYGSNYDLLRESECDMEKYVTSRLIYFHEPNAKNKA